MAGLTGDPGGMDVLLRAFLTGSWPFGLPKEEELAAAIDALPMAAWLYTADGRPGRDLEPLDEADGADHRRVARAWLGGRRAPRRLRERVTCGWNEFAGTEIRTGAHEYRIVHAGTGALRHVADRVVRIDCAAVRLLRRLHRGHHCAGGGAERGAATGRQAGCPAAGGRVRRRASRHRRGRRRRLARGGAAVRRRHRRRGAVRGRRRRAGGRAVVGDADGRPRRGIEARPLRAARLLGRLPHRRRGAHATAATGPGCCCPT